MLAIPARSGRRDFVELEELVSKGYQRGFASSDQRVAVSGAAGSASSSAALESLEAHEVEMGIVTWS